MTKFRITAPVADFTGLSADVNFTNGVAEIDAPVDDPQHADARRVAYFTAAGYRVEPVVEADVVEDGPGPLPAKSASKADWVAAAVARGIDQADADKATKEQLIDLLNTPNDPPAPEEQNS